MNSKCYKQAIQSAMFVMSILQEKESPAVNRSNMVALRGFFMIVVSTNIVCC
jgi:hypothetical protein